MQRTATYVPPYYSPAAKFVGAYYLLKKGIKPGITTVLEDYDLATTVSVFSLNSPEKACRYLGPIQRECSRSSAQTKYIHCGASKNGNSIKDEVS